MMPAAMPIATPLLRCPSDRVRSQRIRQPSARLICPYRSVVKTGSSQTPRPVIRTTPTGRSSRRGQPTSLKDRWAIRASRPRLPRVIATRRKAIGNQVVGTNSIAANGG